MDWSNEDYVRMYTRETSDDLLLSWKAVALWRAMLCKFDRAGLIATRRGSRGLAALVRIPHEVVEPALAELIDDGRVQCKEVGYFAPNFLAAQSATKSDRQRQREARERRASETHALPNVNESNIDVTSRDSGVTFRDEMSRAVTPRHAPSQTVTLTSADPDPDPDSGVTGPPGIKGSPELDALKRKVDVATAPQRVVQAEMDLLTSPSIGPARTPRRKPRHELPEDWRPDDSKSNRAAEDSARARGVDLELQLARMVDWAKGNGERKADWNATYRNFLRNGRPEPAQHGQVWTKGNTLQGIRKTTIL